MLMGEFSHNLDAKGRLIVPAKFRSELGNEFVITRGMEGCLFGYPMDQWNELEQKMQSLPLTKKNARAFNRLIYSAAVESEIDKQGRVNIPKNLIDYAALDKKCVMVGVANRIEIWSEDRWNAFSKDAEENFEEISEDLLDIDF